MKHSAVDRVVVLALLATTASCTDSEPLAAEIANMRSRGVWLGDIRARSTGEITLFPFRADPRRAVQFGRYVRDITPDGKNVVLGDDRYLSIASWEREIVRSFVMPCFPHYTRASDFGRVLVYGCKFQMFRAWLTEVFVWVQGTDPIKVTTLSEQPEIAISGNGDAILMASEGQVSVARSPGWRVETLASGGNATISPDGRFIAFHEKPGAVTIMDTRGEVPVRRLDGRKAIGPVHWSPDQQYLFIVEAHDSLPCSSTQVRVLRVRDGVAQGVLDPCLGLPSDDYRWVQSGGDRSPE